MTAPDGFAIRFADDAGRVWRVALAPDADDVLEFTSEGVPARRLHDFPDTWHRMTVDLLRELLAHTALDSGQGRLP